MPAAFVNFIRFKDKTGVSELYKCRDRSNNFLPSPFLLGVWYVPMPSRCIDGVGVEESAALKNCLKLEGLDICVNGASGVATGS